MCVLVCMYVHRCACICACGDQKSTLGVLSQKSTLPLETGSLIFLKVAPASYPDWLENPTSVPASQLKYDKSHMCIIFLHGTWLDSQPLNLAWQGIYWNSHRSSAIVLFKRHWKISHSQISPLQVFQRARSLDHLSFALLKHRIQNGTILCKSVLKGIQYNYLKPNKYTIDIYVSGYLSDL